MIRDLSQQEAAGYAPALAAQHDGGIFCQAAADPLG
jgi:hypothetical protein